MHDGCRKRRHWCGNLQMYFTRPETKLREEKATPVICKRARNRHLQMTGIAPALLLRDEIGCELRLLRRARQVRLRHALEQIRHIVPPCAHGLESFEVAPNLIRRNPADRVPVLSRDDRHLQNEAFTIPKAIRLFDQPADFIVEAFHFSIADMPKSPETDHSVKFIPDCPSHAFSFRNAGLFCKFDPAMMHAAPERFEQATAATVTGCQGGASMPGMAALPAAFGYLAAETTFTLPPVFAMRAAAILPLQRVVDSGTRER